MGGELSELVRVFSERVMVKTEVSEPRCPHRASVS